MYKKMAIAKFKKLQLVAHNTVRETLLEELQQIGGVHIVDWREGDLEEEQAALESSVATPQTEAAPMAEAALSKIEYCLKFIKPFEPSLGFMEKLAQGKPQVNLTQLKTLEAEFDLNQVYRQCQELEHQVHELHQHTQQFQTQLVDFHPWLGLDVPLDELQETATTYLYPLQVAQEHDGDFSQRLRECLSEQMVLHEVSREGDYHYLLLIILKEDKPLLESCLVDFEVEQVKLPPQPYSPQQIIQRAQEGLAQTEQELQRLQEQSAKLLCFKENLEKLYDYYHNRKKQQEVHTSLFNTSKTLLLEGWVCESKVDKLKQRLENKFQEIAINLREPGEDETPPVQLLNRGVINPFEAITRLYGLPHSKELDPTPLLAPFFFIFFGLCLTDAGYGILLILGSFWCLRKLSLGEGPRQMVRLFVLAGLATVLAGAATGGWFGNIIDLLPPAFAPLQVLKNKMMIFDPIKDPMTFMVLSLVLGYIQICFGIAVKMYDNIRHRAWADALLVQVPWLMLLLGIGVYCLEIAKIGGDLVLIRKALVYSGVGALLILSPYKERNPLKRLGMGLLELYNIVAYMSDVLSYSRLLALGLATGVIGMVVNKIALLTTGVPVVGYLLMVIIMVGGHLFNLAINALGAFVHTSRLQFVEFFPKFFEGGGKAFAPFCWEEKYSIYQAEERG